MNAMTRKACEPEQMGGKSYARNLRALQTELCHLQEWVRRTGARIIVVARSRYAC